jgi:hypothetical protein
MIRIKKTLSLDELKFLKMLINQNLISLKLISSKSFKSVFVCCVPAPNSDGNISVRLSFLASFWHFSTHFLGFSPFFMQAYIENSPKRKKERIKEKRKIRGKCIERER